MIEEYLAHIVSLVVSHVTAGIIIGHSPNC